MPKKRIDQLLVELNMAETRDQAARLLMAGKVLVNDQPITSPGMLVATTAEVRVKESMPYVSRGGYKLAAALDAFALSPADAICADVGASTGGFTDVLLQRGAAKVYAIDVGYGDLAWKLRQDPRVVVMERTNARKLESLPEPVSMAVIDASFISLKLILPAVQKWLTPEANIVALVKPQFEAPKSMVEKGGVVKDRAAHEHVLRKIIDWSGQNRLTVVNLGLSPVKGPAGNREFLLHLSHPLSKQTADTDMLIQAVLGQIDYKTL